MSRRRVALGVVLAAGAAALVLLAWGGDGPQAVAAAGAPATSRPAAGPGSSPSPAGAELAAPDTPVVSGDAFVLVVDAADGRPLEGAQVFLSRVESRSVHMRMPDERAVTDARGRADFVGLEPHQYDLAVHRPHFRSHDGPFSAGEIIALAPIPPLHGRVVTAAGAPVALARVTSTGVDSAETVTGRDGSFELRAPMVDQLVAEKDGVLGLSKPLDDDALDLRDPIEIVLGAVESDALRVVGRDGAPLAGVRVETRVRQVALQQTTGADGVFSLPRLDDVFLEVHFEKAGYVPLTESFSSFRDEDDIVLSRPTRVEGQVVELDGRPVPGASVSIDEPYDLWNRPEPVTTDRDGRFEFRALAYPRVRLRSLVGAHRWAEAYLDLPEGKTVQARLVVRPELVPVKFEVVTPRGRPHPYCEVVATPVPAVGWDSRAGRFGDLELLRGRFYFEVGCEDGRAADATLDVDPRPGMEPLRFTVHGDGGQQFEDELPAARLPVLAVTPEGAAVSEAEVECFDARGLTGPDGRFLCEVHASDPRWPIHVLVKKGPAHGLARATGREGEVRVVLRQAGTLRGRVDGALPSADLFLDVRTASDQQTVPLVGNTFALENRPAIRTFVCVDHVPKEQPDDAFTLGCSVSEGGEELVIPVGGWGAVTFFAKDAKGAPIPEPIAYVDRVRQEVDAIPGGFRLELPPGQHVLVLNQDGTRARNEQRFAIVSGKDTALGALVLE